MSYKSPRLLVEAIHTKIDEQRQMLMSVGDDTPFVAVNSDLQEGLNDLRKLFDELAAMADRPSIDDVTKLAPGDYVATMKPLVRTYHQQLMTVDKLAPALCEDLKANAVVLILVGDGNTVVRTAHDPAKDEVALVVETLLAAIDAGTKQIVDEGAAAAEKQLSLGGPLLMEEDDQPLRVRYADMIQDDDAERNLKAELVIDCCDVVVKDRNGPVGRKATQEEIDSCIVVKDPSTGVGYEEEV
jgi:hypothetical protein